MFTHIRPLGQLTAPAFVVPEDVVQKVALGPADLPAPGIVVRLDAGVSTVFFVVSSKMMSSTLGVT